MKHFKEGRICFKMLSCMTIIKYLYPGFLTLLSIRLTQSYMARCSEQISQGGTIVMGQIKVT